MRYKSLVQFLTPRSTVQLFSFGWNVQCSLSEASLHRPMERSGSLNDLEGIDLEDITLLDQKIEPNQNDEIEYGKLMKTVLSMLVNKGQEFRGERAISVLNGTSLNNSLTVDFFLKDIRKLLA